MTDTYDVVVIGFGPCGQMMCAQLAQAGHSVVAFERHAQLYGLSRAGHIDDEIMRTLQKVGAGEEFREDAVAWEQYDMRTKAFGGELLLGLDWSQVGPHGYRGHWIFYQNNLEMALNRQVQATGRVEVHMSSQATSFSQDADGITVSVHDYHHGTDRTVHGKYLIAADGANSFVRETLGITSAEGTLGPNQLVIDTVQRRPLSFEFDNGQFADPDRPGCLFQLGKTHRRWEFTLREDEDPADFTIDKVWELLGPWVTPDDVEVIRHPVYRFRETKADEWQRDRIFLVGDSAHTMWPFAGEGMCNGIRDANALAWRIDLVLRGLADPSLLDSYRDDREPNLQGWTDLSREMGLPCILFDKEAAAQRDAYLQACLRDPSLMAPLPAIPGPSAFARPGDEAAGLAATQGLVRVDGKEGLLDDVVGTGFQLITTSADALAAISSEQGTALKTIGVHIIQIGPPGSNAPVIDLDDTMTSWLGDLGLASVLVRPDFYLFGGATTPEDTGELVQAFLDGLAGRPTDAGPTPLGSARV